MSEVSKSAVSLKRKPREKDTNLIDTNQAVELSKLLQEQTTLATKNAVEMALKHAEEVSERIISKVTNRMNEINDSMDSLPVLHVQVNETEIQKLDTVASPHLGRMIANAQLGLNTLLVGPAGSGKTSATEQLAKVLKRQYGYLNLTAGASETWLLGRHTPEGFINGIFAELYEKGGVFLADEIDAADPNLLLTLNTAIASNKLYNPMNGRMIERHKDFVFVGAANTYGKGASATYTGRARLDGSTLDRFVVIKFDYDENIEKQVCPDDQLRVMFNSIRKELQKVQSEEIVSTRGLSQAYRQISAGIDPMVVLNSMVLSWPKDLQTMADKNFKTYLANKGSPVTETKTTKKVESSREWF